MNYKRFSFFVTAAAFSAGAVFLGIFAFFLSSLPIPAEATELLDSQQWMGIALIRGILTLSGASAYAMTIVFCGLALGKAELWDRIAGKWLAIGCFLTVTGAGLAGCICFAVTRPVV